MDEIERARAALRFESREECFFRGNTNKNHPLLPTLMRLKLVRSRTFREVEQSLFFEFQSRARDLHGQGLSDFDYLFYMRHYGLPTRILDWTESLASALFFALRGKKGASPSPCIWLLNPYALNEPEWGRDLVAPRYLGWDEKRREFFDYGDLLLEADGIFWDSPVGIYPLQRNVRMAAQRGWFTMHGRNEKPLDKIRPDVVRRIDISPAAAQVASWLLTQIGIDKFALFGDLDSLCESLAEKNELTMTRAK